MAINAVEARIRSYSNEQLRGVREVVNIQVSRLVTGIEMGDIFPTLRMASSALSQVARHRFGSMIYEPDSLADIAAFMRVSRVAQRVEILTGLSRKLDLEARRREIYPAA